MASLNGHAEVVSLLLGSGAHLDSVDLEGNTALMLASESGHVEVVRLLLGRPVVPFTRFFFLLFWLPS